MRTLDIINIIAIIVSPVVAVVVGQILQDRRKNSTLRRYNIKYIGIILSVGNAVYY